MRTFGIILTLLVVSSCRNTAGDSDISAGVFDEQGLKSFVLSIPAMPVEERQNVMDSILLIVSNDSTLFRQTISDLEKPFGDNPNSTYRREDLYRQLLQAKLKSPWTDSATKVKTRERLYLLMQNQPGAPANDFDYITASGSKKRMSALKSEYLLLFFYNPECDACKQMKAALTASPAIHKAMASGKLKVLGIYTDKDEKTWLNHLPDMPAEWVHGRDNDEYLYKNKVYDLRAIPTLYLLDENKNVLLKDAMSVAAIETALMGGLK